MKIKVNNKETELTQGNNVASLAQQLELPQQGVAVALNNRIAASGLNRKSRKATVLSS